MQIYANFHFKTMLTTFTVKVVALLKKRGLLSRLFEKISEKKKRKGAFVLRSSFRLYFVARGVCEGGICTDEYLCNRLLKVPKNKGRPVQRCTPGQVHRVLGWWTLWLIHRGITLKDEISIFSKLNRLKLMRKFKEKISEFFFR